MGYSELEGVSISKSRIHFCSLDPVDVQDLEGVYRAEFTGPLWLRIIAGPSLSLTGLHGWWGKEFLEENIAFNLVRTASGIEPKLQMEMIMSLSPIDEKSTASLTYSLDAPFPWRYVTDELRRLDENRILGLTYVNRPLLYKIAFPFILLRQEK